ncbi:DUF5686 and carboxypeptidase regulatory-like domain-containing protein [Hymenobacter sp. BT175]|uniref:DUF5686 and carboxypeptidase-like regulatory domain-containing protein n=1 Tax=Hymenobacter translucens TaxID=2886507 RepID=UPI001D0EA699|nr:DUF5686 and carboxypeptidase-like regulatory domain-containing protein [Hymenobacter translucens]MCC2546168.1 DUF5686 and carboxypeptidase regulatory-like domain-containing protein [Hymenobacter translucens]
MHLPLFNLTAQPGSAQWALLLWAVLLSGAVAGQQPKKNTVSGVVVEAANGEGIPMASVYFRQTPQKGTSTAVDGQFVLERSAIPGDTLLIVSSIGFKPETLAVSRHTTRLAKIRLKTTATELKEVVVKAGENPAYAVIRNAVANRDRNHIEALASYELESYNSLAVYLTNAEKVQNSSAMREVKKLMQRQGKSFRDRQGRVIIPLTVTETVSNNYYLRQSRARKEQIVRTKTAGIGLETDDGLTQLMSGNGFRDYNFYQNRLRILDKSVPSPLADGWRFNYEFWLEDSVRIGNDECYRIAVVPRRATDIVFQGTIWVSRDGFGLRKVDLRLAPDANINYVQSLHIRQEGEHQGSGVWLAKCTDYEVELNLASINPSMPGVRLNLRTINTHLVAKPIDASFFEESRPTLPPILAAPAVAAVDTAYWRSFRTVPSDSIPAEPAPYELIDSIKQLPSIRKYTFWGRVLASGYVPMGKLDFGNILNTYAWNNVEGHRIGVGLRTNETFNRNLNLDGMVAYSTQLRRFNYNASVARVLSREHFTQVGVRTRSDVEPLALLASGLSPTAGLLAFNHIGNLRRRNPFDYSETSAWLEREVRPGLTTRLAGNYRSMTGLYRRGPVFDDDERKGEERSSTVTTTELELGLRFNQQERSMRTKNNKLRMMRRQVAPTLNVVGVVGFRNGRGDGPVHSYQKLLASLTQRQLSVFGFGTADYVLQAGYVFGRVPYSLLKIHQGNGTPFLFRNGSQTMRSFEFASDHFMELHYTHYFNDLILGQIPGVRTVNKFLDWRLLATTNVVWGGMREENVRLNELTLPSGRVITPFRTLGLKPYVEVGYGVENILHILRVDFVHRLTYRDLPEGASRKMETGNFVVKVSAAFKM